MGQPTSQAPLPTGRRLTWGLGEGAREREREREARGKWAVNIF